MSARTISASLLASFCVVLACGGAPPRPAVPPLPAPPPNASMEVSCIEQDASLTRGLVVQKGADGQPVIRVGLFRDVAEGGQGRLEFDLAALTKAGGELEGNSEAREYVIRMRSSGTTSTARIDLQGVYKLVRLLDGEVSYANLAEVHWACNRLPDSHRQLAYFRDDECRGGKQRATFVCRPGDCCDVERGSEQEAARGLETGDYRFTDEELRRRFSLARASLAECWNNSVRAQREALARLAASLKETWDACNPTGHVMSAFDGQGVVRLFSPSTSPLYPPPDFYTTWGYGDDIKPAFQIYWLITKQKFKTTGRW